MGKLKAVGFSFATGHRDKGQVNFNLGKIGEDMTFKTGCIPVMEKIKALHTAGKGEDVVGKAKTAFFDTAAELQYITADKDVLLPPCTCRYVVVQKPEAPQHKCCTLN